MVKRSLLLFGAFVTGLLLWFAASDYRAAAPMAVENLRGLALTMSAAIENAAQNDPSFGSLADFRPADLAYFAIIDPKGMIRFHSNPDLIGTVVTDERAMDVVRGKTIVESRVVLGTGEEAYEFDAPIYVRGRTYALRLTLHTYRADAVIRRARLSLALLVSLIGAAWLLAVVIFRLASRAEGHRQEMARRENLARLGEMGAMLAHEIRNPLAGIKGYAQVIEKRPVEERNGPFAHRIVTEVLRLEGLVNDLLAFARSEPYPMAPLHLRGVIDHTRELIGAEAEELDVRIDVSCPEELQVSGNRDRLGQLLLNLAKNALQAMPGGGTLRISASRAGRDVTLRVADTGTGIDGQELERVFEPFFTTKARGTGLGLPLCRKIAEEHGGTIAVESSPGEGTTVTVTLPPPDEHRPNGSRP